MTTQSVADAGLSHATQSRVIDYHIRLSESVLIDFANCIKDAIVERCAASERFSSVRLRNTDLSINDFQRHDTRGRAFGDGRIEVRQSAHALQLAGTVMHELAHQLIGVTASHNDDWFSAAKYLGFARVEAAGQDYQPSDFAPDVLAVIAEAISRFAAENPELFFDPNCDIPYPAGMLPMPFQIDGVREMLARPRGILLADEMGCGKTVQAILYMNVMHPKRVLIGCPNNAKLIWKRHIDEWCVWDDLKENVEVAYTSLYMFGDVVIMNYEALTKWSDALRKAQWDLIIYDEGHYLKTPSAKRSKAAYAIDARKKIIITGTPIVNYPYELFPLIHWLDRDNWWSYPAFEAQYGSRTSNKLGRNLNRLQATLRATIMTRRTKKEVLSELPRKRRSIVEFEPNDDEKRLIDEEMSLWKQATGGDDFESVRLLNALKNESETANDDVDWAALIESLAATKKYLFTEMSRIAHLIGLAKVPYVIQHINDTLENRDKVIVFGHHRDVMTQIHRAFPGSVLLMGGNRDAALAMEQASQRFNTDPNCRVFIGQLQNAQAYSLKGSSTVLVAEQDWVPGIITQAEDRAHGIGRGDEDARSMLIQHLVFTDSLDTHKAKKVIAKQRSIDRAMNRRPELSAPVEA